MSIPKFYQYQAGRTALLLGALIVVIASGYFTTHISQQLKDNERQRIELWAEAQKRLMTATDQELEFCDLTLHSLIQESNTNIPLILTDGDLRVIDAKNYTQDVSKDKVFFAAEIKDLNEHSKPIIIETPLYKNYIFYRNSTLITALDWFPYIQFALIGVFILVAYLTWSAGRQAEQERVWVGMAKETAHQLGTPISSLIGWVENLKLMYEGDENIEMIGDEITKDIRLLQIVAERFSKIGAIPELAPTNIIENLHRYHDYIKQRASRKITFDFPNKDEHPPVIANINTLLFDWVVENLLKNALDAMEGSGEITVKVSTDANWVYIDFHDTGKGMPKNLYKKIFQPGFSTKKRGWGLGLSLCKRIIENYHKGRIFVRHSSVGQGTIFRIQLPQLNG